MPSLLLFKKSLDCKGSHVSFLVNFVLEHIERTVYQSMLFCGLSLPICNDVQEI